MDMIIDTYRGVKIYTNLDDEFENAFFELNGKRIDCHDLNDGRAIIENAATESHIGALEATLATIKNQDSADASQYRHAIASYKAQLIA